MQDSLLPIPCPDSDASDPWWGCGDLPMKPRYLPAHWDNLYLRDPEALRLPVVHRMQWWSSAWVPHAQVSDRPDQTLSVMP